MKSKIVLVAATVALWISPSFAAEIFSKPLHIKRIVEDPISKSSTTIDEYASGNSVVSVIGERTAIFDYAAAKITVIDRSRGTFSVSTFEEYAAAQPQSKLSAKSKVASDGRWEVRELSPSTHAGRVTDVRAAHEKGPGASRVVTVATARDIELSADGFDALMGTRYPGTASEEADVVRLLATRTAAASGKTLAQYALPLSTSITYGEKSEDITFRNSVIHVDAERIPPHLLLIPPGATRVASPFESAERKLDDLNRLP